MRVQRDDSAKYWEMKMSKQDPWQKRIRQTLDKQQVDDATRLALQVARNTALDGTNRRPLPGWARATAFATLLLAVAAVVTLDSLQDDGFPRAEVDDLVVIDSEDEFELYEELEFYLWLDEEENV